MVTIIISLIIGSCIGATGMALLSGRAYEKGYKDAKR